MLSFDLQNASAGCSLQGAERDVILVTTCRTSLDGPLSFIANPLRLNVTITRARHHLLIIGHVSASIAPNPQPLPR